MSKEVAATLRPSPRHQTQGAREQKCHVSDICFFALPTQNDIDPYKTSQFLFYKNSEIYLENPLCFLTKPLILSKNQREHRDHGM